MYGQTVAKTYFARSVKYCRNRSWRHSLHRSKSALNLSLKNKGTWFLWLILEEQDADLRIHMSEMQGAVQRHSQYGRARSRRSRLPWLWQQDGRPAVFAVLRQNQQKELKTRGQAHPNYRLSWVLRTNFNQVGSLILARGYLLFILSHCFEDSKRTQTHQFLRTLHSSNAESFMAVVISKKLPDILLIWIFIMI